MDNTTGLLIDQAGAAIGIVKVIEFLKLNERFPWLNMKTDQWNKLVSYSAAILTTIGFSIAMSGNIHTGGTITITFPSLDSIGQTLLHILIQIGMQDFFYHNAVKKVSA